MDPLHAWKDDFRREVEEVLASRSRVRERGDAPGDEGFGGRLADMVIPPAGTYAQLRETVKQLELAHGELVELRERLGAKEGSLERERESRERLKDGIARLALALRDERAARAAAQEEAKRAREEAQAAKIMLAGAHLDAEQAAARGEDWEREALARLRGARDIQARLDRALLEADAKDAEAASLKARLAAAMLRTQEADANSPLAVRLEREKLEALGAAEAARQRCASAQAAERAAAQTLAALEDALRLQTARAVNFERESAQKGAEAARVLMEADALRERALAGERVAAANAAETERKIAEANATAESEARLKIESAYAEGVAAARLQVGVAKEKEGAATKALLEFREKLRERLERFAAAAYAERERADAAVADANHSLAKALARLAAEGDRGAAKVEEARALMRAEFEEARARLESEMDAERRAMRARWQEQAEALERLRKEFERGRQGT